MNEKNLKNIWLLSIFVILVLFSVYLIRINDNESNVVQDSTNKVNYQLVTNYNNFFTVNSCVYRYLTYVQGRNTSSILKVLDEDFITSNGINETNLYNFITMYEGNLNFNSQEMYEEKVNDNITKYYVYGYVEKDVMNSLPERIDAYYIVNLDEKNKVFTIMPYNGDIFK